MPIYEFITDDGSIVEELCEAPPKGPRIGDQISVDGRRLTRVASSAQVGAHVGTAVHGYPYTSLSMPRWSKGCKHTKDGKPIINSQRHERQVMARLGRQRD